MEHGKHMMKAKPKKPPHKKPPKVMPRQSMLLKGSKQANH